MFRVKAINIHEINGEAKLPAQTTDSDMSLPVLKKIVLHLFSHPNLISTFTFQQFYSYSFPYITDVTGLDSQIFPSGIPSFPKAISC